MEHLNDIRGEESLKKRRVAPPPTQMNVEEVMEAAGVGRNVAYQIIKKLNAELEAMGTSITFRGRVNRKFFEEKICYDSRET